MEYLANMLAQRHREKKHDVSSSPPYTDITEQYGSVCGVIMLLHFY